MNIFITRLMAIVLLSASLFSLRAQSGQKALNDLEREFSKFAYEKVIKKGEYYLGESYINQKDSLAIYTYLLNAAYALQDTSRARRYINGILDINGNYSMDAKTTSPKIIELFEMVKKQRPRYPGPEKKSPPAKSAVIRGPSAGPGLFLSTLALPGSGHWQAGLKPEAYYKTGISGALLTALLYTTVQAARLEKSYLSASLSGEFEARYADYNRMYKSRNFLIGAYVAWGLYNVFDLAESMPGLHITNTGERISLGLNIRLR